MFLEKWRTVVEKWNAQNRSVRTISKAPSSHSQKGHRLPSRFQTVLSQNSFWKFKANSRNLADLSLASLSPLHRPQLEPHRSWSRPNAPLQASRRNRGNPSSRRVEGEWVRSTDLHLTIPNTSKLQQLIHFTTWHPNQSAMKAIWRRFALSSQRIRMLWHRASRREAPAENSRMRKRHFST